MSSRGGYTVVELFSGMGLFSVAFKQAGHRPIAYVEIDKYAWRSCKAINLLTPEEQNTLLTISDKKQAIEFLDSIDIKERAFYAEDIKRIHADELPKADIWTAGFPCQDISVAGRREGLKGNRSGLFHRIIRLIEDLEEENRPSYLILENVKNIFSVNRGFDFLTVLLELDKIGYDAEWDTLQSKEVVPQSRERVCIIGHIATPGRSTRKIFPIKGTDGETPKLKQLIGGSQGNRVYDPSGLSCTIASQGGGGGANTGLYLIDMTKTDGKSKITDNARCLTTRYNTGLSNRGGEHSGVLEVRPVINPKKEQVRQQGRRFKGIDEPSFTITSQDRHGVYIKDSTTGILNEKRIRWLTLIECARLQGVSDRDIQLALSVNSDTQVQKQIGNAVTVPVFYQIASLIEIKDDEKS